MAETLESLEATRTAIASELAQIGGADRGLRHTAELLAPLIAWKRAGGPEDRWRAPEMTDVPPHADLEQLHPASFGWALACCRHDREEAQEVLQKAYVNVLDGRSSAKTWVFAVIFRIASSRRRRGWLRGLALSRWVDGQPAPAAASSPESVLRTAEATALLRQALLALPERQRQILHLVFYQDLTLEAASQVLGISLGSARTHYHRGKQALRRRLPEVRP